jgi:hypothetical protein
MNPDNATKPRTIDERLDGLTQTLEVIAGMQRDNERRFAETDKRFQENEIRFAAIASNISDLVKVAQLHERS